MSLIVRTASIQARVVPAIKEASEQVLFRIGLNMSEAMELFLRRIIVDERIPFEVVALDARYLSGTSEKGNAIQVMSRELGGQDESGGVRKKNSKVFLRPRTSSEIKGTKRVKKS